MNVIISGLTGAGKSTQARILSAVFGLKYVSGAAVRLQALGGNPTEAGSLDWKMSNDAEKLDDIRMTAPEMDFVADRSLLKMARYGDHQVFDVWTLPWLTEPEDGLRILLKCNFENRVRNVSLRRALDEVGATALRKWMKRKDRVTADFVKRHYSIDILRDRRVFDVIVDQDRLFAIHHIESRYKVLSVVAEILMATVSSSLGDGRSQAWIRECACKFPASVIIGGEDA